MSHSCIKCGNPANSHCARCKKTHYCGRECQQAHWSEHRSSCLAAAMLNLPPTDPVKSAMANFYASMSREEIVASLMEDPGYKRRKEDLDYRLAGGGNVRELFLRANKGIIGTDNAYVLLYQSVQAIGRSLDNKEQEGDFLGLHPIPIEELLKSYPGKSNLAEHKSNPDMIYVTVCHSLPLSKMRSDLQDITITHCVTMFTRGESKVDIHFTV